MTTSQAQVEAILVIAQDIRTQRALSLSTTVVLVYDAILSFPDELEYIWKARWTWGKFLYLMSRYATLSGFIFWEMVTLGFGVSLDKFCTAMVYFTIWAIHIFSIPAHAVLTMRTIAIWDRDRKVVAILLIVAAAQNIITTVCNILLIISFRSDYKANHLLEPLIGCFADSPSAPPSKTIVSFVGRSVKIKLVSILVRDGAVYYAALFVLSVATLLFGGVLPSKYSIITEALVLATLSVESLGSCHIILNLREYSHKLERLRSINLPEFSALRHAQRRTIMDEFSVHMPMENSHF